TGPSSTLGVGTCVRGLSTCDVTGTFGECVGQVVPVDEICDGKDNDCDGETDEDLGTTTCGRGICTATSTNCIGGVPQVCTPKPSQPETCNAIDDDCNGTVDDDCDCVNGQTRACYTGAGATQGVGVCRGGTSTCAAGRWGACAGEITPHAETCNLQDDDCDGQVDEGLGSTSCGVGTCSTQVNNCVAGQPRVCVPLAPSPETCDGLDNDCNGIVDNGSPGAGTNCNSGRPGVCSAGTTACTNGAIVCNQNVQTSAEVCDGLDNDCNGAVDNGNPGGAQNCNTGKQGVCSAGTTACTGGDIVCNQNVQPSAEICDGFDNDCNGVVDNGNPGGGGNCNTGEPGLCAAGIRACAAGALVCNQTVQAVAEVCDDDKDNDCDGQVDEADACPP
ncbi:MAG: hypothetical protein EOO74_07600, partial [Myxococcales bacterium]